MIEADRLAQLAEQEERLQFTKFDNETALALGQQLLTAARDRGLPVTISIRRNGQRLFHAALPGTSADNDAWIDRKSRVVDRYGRSSFYIGTQFRSKGGSFEEHSRLDPDLYAAHGGVFPVLVRGVGPVGTVGVSGLPQADDHAFVVEQLELFLSS
ncbi:MULTISPECIES: heme-degrading domain-containing protein [unclassified Amycolatopsis]|uniref:heme-degrading domain-containing protein n=1 Tax=unclassified Amycolatopsis TaxID=2618356 RepID=UPI00287450F3|nr:MULTISPECIES: heme-degrading domain-containing protein [unclassified Amycolatopsis]MDS0133881.1 heme-degrading domain-containing protein [Amycolatopsis sp. 505]MDS0144757.1 heme-degrading domain-containing protein [Amycolatopsis sp. CM201R]